MDIEENISKINEHIERVKEYLEYGMPYSEYLDLQISFETILNELDKKDKRLKRQFKIITKRDKQIEEIKQIAHNDFEERCKLTFKIEKLENKLDKQEKIIKLMAEELANWYMDNPIDDRKINKQYVINKFTNKVEEDK